MRAARRAPSPISRCFLAVGGEALDRLDRNWRREFGADLVARGPFDDGVGAFAAGEDQPHPRADLKASLAGGHEAAFGDVEHLGFDAASAELAHLRIDLDGKPGEASAVRKIFGYS